MQSENYYQSSDGLRLFFRDFSLRDGLVQDNSVDHTLPVLCLHGLTRNSRDFTDLAEHLSKTHRVIVPDVRGRGFSAFDPQPEHYQPAFYAADMWALLDHLGIQRCVVIGTSMGGVIGMIMAVQQPQRIAGLVLNDVGPELDGAGLARIAGYVGIKSEINTWDDAAAWVRTINGTALPEYSAAQWLQFARNTFREDAHGVPRADYDPTIASQFSQIDNADATAKAWMVFDMLRQPLLVLRGAISDLLSAATVTKMQSRHPDCTTAEIPGRGHAPMLNEPASLTAVDMFLELLKN